MIAKIDTKLFDVLQKNKTVIFEIIFFFSTEQKSFATPLHKNDL